jgi:hypothetical protein
MAHRFIAMKYIPFNRKPKACASLEQLLSYPTRAAHAFGLRLNDVVRGTKEMMRNSG